MSVQIRRTGREWQILINPAYPAIQNGSDFVALESESNYPRARQMQVLLQSSRLSTPATFLVIPYVYWLGLSAMGSWPALAWCLPLICAALLYTVDIVRYHKRDLACLGEHGTRHAGMSLPSPTTCMSRSMSQATSSLIPACCRRYGKS